MNNYKILVVDDIFINRILLCEIIDEIGAIHLEASDGEIAIKIIKEQKPDIILMDVEMPVMNGFETTKYIRNKLKEPFNKIPIVAITAHDPNYFVEEYKNSGFDDMITKPYTTSKINNLIKKYCS